MGVNCIINFENNPEKVVYSNDLLRGHVQLKLTEPKSVQGIYIKFSGDSRTEWFKEVRDEMHKERTVRRYYRGHEIILTKEIRLFGQNAGLMQIESGEYVYEFQFRLPAGSPSSFEGEFGHIRYIATVVLDIPRWPDDEFQQPFTVIKPLDLNDDLELRNPVTVQENHTYNPCYFLCCFPSDPLSIDAHLPVGGYAPGQTMNLSLTADNQSNTRVPEFTMELIQFIKYYADGETKQQSIVIKEKKSSRGIGVNMKRIIRINLEVPSSPPTDETSSSIIKINYFIRISGTGTFCENPEIDLPIVIGTKPIDDYAVTTPPNEYNHFAPSAPIDTTNIQPIAPQIDAIPNNDDSIPSYTTVAPPTYEEAIHSKGSTGNNYKPKYRMFRRQTSYSSKSN